MFRARFGYTLRPWLESVVTTNFRFRTHNKLSSRKRRRTRLGFTTHHCADGGETLLMTHSASADLEVFESHRPILVAHAYRMLCWAISTAPKRSEEHTSELQSHHDLV